MNVTPNTMFIMYEYLLLRRVVVCVSPNVISMTEMMFMTLVEKNIDWRMKFINLYDLVVRYYIGDVNGLKSGNSFNI